MSVTCSANDFSPMPEADIVRILESVLVEHWAWWYKFVFCPKISIISRDQTMAAPRTGSQLLRKKKP